MQRDAWYSSMRDASELASPQPWAAMPPSVRLSRLKGRKIPRQVPVLFESPLAAGLLGALVQGTQRRRAVPQGQLPAGQPGQAGAGRAHRHHRRPALPRARAAPRSTTRACARARQVVEAGVVQGYFLSSYSARKLGMRPPACRRLAEPGAAQPPDPPGDDLDKMLRKLGRGLFVTELMGQGVNYVTGDYSRGASGYWVENGRIAYPVHEITIAGNLKDMLPGFTAHAGAVGLLESGRFDCKLA
jgi:PmbA protein